MKIILSLFAVVALVGIARRVAHRRRGCNRHPGGRGRRGFGRMAHKLGLSSEQQDVVRREAKAFRAKLKSLRSVGPASRTRLAAVMRSSDFDENELGEMFVEHDDALRELRLEFVERLAHVFDALDLSQRERLADWLERGMGGGPFRGGFAPV